MRKLDRLLLFCLVFLLCTASALRRPSPFQVGEDGELIDVSRYYHGEGGGGRWNNNGNFDFDGPEGPDGEDPIGFGKALIIATVLGVWMWAIIFALIFQRWELAIRLTISLLIAVGTGIAVIYLKK